VLAFGNGGSAADAQHFAAELVGRFQRERAAWPALALTTDTSILTAVGNDLGYESVFRRQVEAHGRRGDVAVGISTSGRSPNVLAALRLARERGLVTVALTGQGGGEAADLADHLIDVPHRDTARVQEVHAMVVHVLCQIVEEDLAGA
jgi:D-sedoheptulose 7-phosphate isomerase